MNEWGRAAGVGVGVVLLILFAMFLGSCAPYDDATGTTLEERCVYRRAAVERLEAREHLSDAEQLILENYRDFVAVSCVSVPE